MGKFMRWCLYHMLQISKDAKIRNRYNQLPHLTQDTNGKVTNSQLDATNESQEVSPFPSGDHKAHINRRAQRHSKHKTEKHKRAFLNVRNDISGGGGRSESLSRMQDTKFLTCIRFCKGSHKPSLLDNAISNKVSFPGFYI